MSFVGVLSIHSPAHSIYVGAVISISKSVISRVFESLPNESVAVIVQSVYVHSPSEFSVIVLFPEIAPVVVDAQDPE